MLGQERQGFPRGYPIAGSGSSSTAPALLLFVHLQGLPLALSQLQFERHLQEGACENLILA